MSTNHKSICLQIGAIVPLRDRQKIKPRRNCQIIEQGKHEDLLARNGIYASLWRMRFGNN
ncbi:MULTISPECIES: hypothetical protein [Chroococcidiopsis]|uniref:hypothetical protein n=1 Tax=Chroococcidiopsis TaxID=54298 RepID=UPI0015F02042|nr:MULTISPECIES: hypothetical protein [Chroococcidiopsis]URD48543.1 hypothetical protein M5J74_19635 [Chroococcidiopsis sp. CCNUC1]